MAASQFEREANDLAWELVDKLNEATGRTFVVEGSTWYRKYLQIVDTDDWKRHVEFIGNTWEDTYRCVRAAYETAELLGGAGNE